MSNENETPTDNLPATENKNSEGQENDDGEDAPLFKEIKSETHVLKAKRKYHPRDHAYNGIDSFQETMVAEIMYTAKFTPEQDKLYVKGKLIFNPENTEKVWNEILPNDIIGYKGYRYKILRKTKNSLITNKMKPKFYRNDEDEFEEKETKITKPQLDFALNTNFAEILYRNGKVYGMSEDIEMKVKVKVFEDKDGNTYISKTGKEIKSKEQPKENEVTQ